MGITASLPIVVNNFPAGSAGSPEDQYQMAKWNYYAPGVFQASAPQSGYAH